MKNLNSLSLKIFFLTAAIILQSCTERELFDQNVILPTITGLFTEIQGSVSGKLIKNNSPYLVTKDLIVEIGDTLVIEPGVKLYFNERSKLIVKGYLKSEGTRNQRIYFTAYRSSWNGILFSSSNNNSIIKFCLIDKITPIDGSNSQQSGIIFINSSCSITNTYLSNNKIDKSNLVLLLNSNVRIINNIITNNQIQKNLIHSEHSNFRLINNVLFNNKSNNNESTILIKQSIFNEVQNNIFYRNKSDKEINIIESDPQKVILDFNFIGDTSNDPQFWNYETFRLYYLSPCIDAGNPAPEFNDVNGSRNDQGAYGGPGGNW